MIHPNSSQQFNDTLDKIHYANSLMPRHIQSLYLWFLKYQPVKNVLNLEAFRIIKSLTKEVQNSDEC
jgi:hypothetical protein